MTQSTFTREELFDLVWADPVTKVAAQFGLSDVAIRKTCVKYGIPTPPLGYWAKLAHGKKVTRPKLAKHPLQDQRIVIRHGASEHESEAMSDARDRATAASLAEPILIDEHPVVTKTMARLRKGKADDRGLVSLSKQDSFAVSMAPASFDRIEPFLLQLIGAFLARDYQLERGEHGIRIAAEGETIGMTISEIVDRVRHEPTEDELERQRRWEAKRARTIARGGWESMFDRPQIPEWDYVPGGRLQVDLEQVYALQGVSPRRKFADGKTQTIESLVEEIVVGIAVLAVVKRERREANERWQRNYEEEQRRRAEAERQAALNARKIKFLDEVLDIRERMGRLEKWLAATPDPTEVGDAPGYVAFHAWAAAYAKELHARLAPEHLDQNISSNSLFPDLDPRSPGSRY